MVIATNTLLQDLPFFCLRMVLIFRYDFPDYNILTPIMLIFGRPVHQENWLDPSQFHDPDYTLVSQQDLGSAFK